MTDEEWRPVVGFEGIYEVSSMGQVRGIERTLTDGKRWAARILKPRMNDRVGYLYVSLYRGGKKVNARIHRLVAQAFVPGEAEGLDVCHGDGVRSNNCASNLRWDTRGGNMRDKRRHGTDHQACKPACPRAHLLVAPNLVASDVKRGHRNCLACSRAKATARYRREALSIALADQHYAAIMTNQTHQAAA